MSATAAGPWSAGHLGIGIIGALMLAVAVALALAVGVTVPTGAAENQEPGTSGTWSQTEPLMGRGDRGADGRAEHTATRLADGQVLAAGGRYLTEYLAREDDLSLQITAEVYDPAEETWQRTACFGNARAEHTATTLADGRVLMTGGVCGRKAHLYDPATGAWEPAGTMNDDRTGHTATRLADGRVLVAGGEKDGTAEIYDPATNSWSETGELTVGRTFHTATRLTDGRVLVAGGRNEASNSSLASAEIFDPETGEWERAAPMATQRHRHTATLLTGEVAECGAHCGKVLVAGGMFQQSSRRDESYQSIATVELYDPTIGTWSQAQPMGTRRSEHTATRLADGRVLVAAGHTVAAGVLGGLSNLPEPERHDSAEIFDPALGQWEEAEKLKKERAAHTATRLGDGRVLVAGGGRELGAGSGPPHLDSVEVYDPDADSWSTSDGALVEGTARHAAAGLADGGALITGGIGEHFQPIASPQRYDPDADTWELVGPEATPRGRHTATGLADGRVLVAGGVGVGDAPQASAEAYDPEGIWEPAGSMAAARGRHTATRLADGRVLVVGGTGANGEALASAETYDPSGGWESAGAMATARSRHTATRLPDGRVLVAGGTGADGQALASAEVYDPDGGGWSSAGALGDTRAGHTATVLGDGRVLVAGGAGSDGTALASAEVYHPDRDEWEAVASMSTARAEHTATADQGGQVLIAGGLDGDRVLKAAEVYHPDLDAWRQTGPMLASRGRHTVTLLTGEGCGEHCGEMLAAGGLGDDSWHNAAELYDPAGVPSGAWALTGSMVVERTEHTTTRLDGPACRDPDAPDYCGRVLVTGGERTVPGQGSSLFERQSVAAAELYDPATGEWAETGSLGNARQEHTATLLDGPPCHGDDPPSHCGKVLVAGGKDGETNSLLATAELYDPADGEWTSTGSLNTARKWHTATLLPTDDGAVLVTGGRTNDGETTSMERYDLVAKTWELAGEMQEDRERHTATPLGGDHARELLIAGSSIGVAGEERYHVDTGSTRPTNSTNELREGHTAQRLPDGRVLVVGHHQSQTGEIYDPDTELWQPTEPAVWTGGHAVTRLADGRVLVAGGKPDNAAQLFDPEAASDQAWSVTGFMNHDRGGHTATRLPAGPKAACAANCGKVLVTGGGQGNGVMLGSAEVYAPQPRVTGIEPVEGLATGGGEVVLEGTGLASVREVWFGDQRVGRDSVELDAQRPDEEFAVTAPPVGEARSVRVRVVTDGGVADAPDEFAYLGPPGKVGDLAGRALSAGRVELGWSAVGATGSAEPPAQRYDIRRATAPIEGEADFGDATQVCDCDYRPGQVGTQLVFEDGTVAADTSYFYAVRAADADGRQGPVSNVAEIATPAEDDAGADGGNGDDGDGAGGDGGGGAGGDDDASGGDGDGGVGPGEVGPPGVIRLAGADRFATAAAASRDAFADGAAGAAVLARADGFADALAGGPLAVARGGPLLVTVSDGLHPTTRDELERVLPPGATVYLLGGEQALSPTVAQEVEALGYQVRRLAGATRVETALAVAGELGDPDRLLVATGFDFPDALAAGAAAAHVDGAVLLTRGDAPSQATADYLAGRGGATVHAVGGSAVNPYAGQADHTLAGAERTATAAEIAEFFFDVPAAAGVARSDDFPDALTGGTHIGRLGGPMLLTPVDRLAGPTSAYLCAATVETAYVYGGTAAVSEATSGAVAARLDGTGC